MCKVISVANIKGGVAKTTTAANLGVGLVKKGKRVLLVDLDPQGSLSLGLGIRNNKELPYTVWFSCGFECGTLSSCCSQIVP